jgi:RNase P/RNase MRP subunit POP5
VLLILIASLERDRRLPVTAAREIARTRQVIHQPTPGSVPRIQYDDGRVRRTMAALDEFVSVPDSEEEDEDEEDHIEDDESEGVLEDLPGGGTHFSCKASRHYMRITFAGSIPGDSLGVQMAIMLSLRTLYGQAGAADAVDVLHYSLKAREAVLSMPSGASTRVRNALTLVSEWEQAPMRAQVVQSSPQLVSLVADIMPL